MTISSSRKSTVTDFRGTVTVEGGWVVGEGGGMHGTASRSGRNVPNAGGQNAFRERSEREQMIVLGSSGVDGHVMGIYFFSKATKGASSAHALL